MLLPIKWLKDYVEIDESTRELSDKLTDSGSHVEAIESLESKVNNVVVGRIERIDKHPNADKLVRTKINIGSELIDIVTGAKNIKVGDYVPVALVGAKLADGMEIEPTDFRGEMSYGMLCSLQEMGYSDSVIPKQYKDGIYILGEEELGKDMRDVLEMNGQVMELEITPNRPDCLSIIGMARETAATFNKKFKKPEIIIKKQVDNISDYIELGDINEDLCTRYYGKVVKDIVIKDSPQWIQNRLMEAGVRPINNIVDITNYVMLEYGQPLHAFDLDKISGKVINIRTAREEEIITTLDKVERKLRKQDLVIADDSKILAVAGVMGGLESEVSEKTKTIFLESANFDSKSVRLTSKYLNLRTDASSRFEKWIDVKLAEEAALRACQLIEETDSGIVVYGEIDAGNYDLEEKTISLRAEKVNSLLGVDLTVEEIESYLNRLEFETSKVDNILEVRVPSHRLDVSRDVDLVEEVGRLYSFGKIELKPLVGEITRGGRSYKRQVESRISDVLLGMGLSKVMSYSFISPRAYDKINVSQNDELRNYIELLNPLGEDYSIMRTTVIPNMLELLSKNNNHGVKECLYFEIGNIFKPNELPVTTLPRQERVLTIGMYGDIDFYFLKESVNLVFKKLDIVGVDYRPIINNLTFHPNRTAEILFDGKALGILGEIHPDVLDNYKMKEKVYIAELDMDCIYEKASLTKKFKQLPKYPSISRDLAVIVDEEVLVGDIEKIVWENDNGIIESFELFDVYSGSQISEGKKSIAFSVVYRSEKGTLKDEEVDLVQTNIIKEIESKLKGELRG